MAERFIAARLVVSAMAFEAMAFEAKAEIAEVTAHANNFFYRLYFSQISLLPLRQYTLFRRDIYPYQKSGFIFFRFLSGIIGSKIALIVAEPTST
ncbi:hypothetical protein A8M56_13685 [Yersinia pestis]|nr:hypothetical protein A8M56_13685 [Yersinia pestis]